MADDIDIEEHGILEDPDFLGIFPDFPHLEVKTEVIDIEDGFDEHHDDLSIPSTSVIPDSTTDVDYQPLRSTESPHIISSTSIPEDAEEPEEITDRLNLDELVKTTHTVLSNNDTSVNILICEDEIHEDVDIPVNDVSINDVSLNEESINNVSINVKPDVSGVVDEFVDDEINDNDNDNDKDAGNDEAFFGNCIILGSKATDVNREEYYEDDKCFNSFVNLEDWGPYLRGSDCYCSECEILFATVNALDFHKMQAHSHLVAVFGDGDDAYASDDSPKADTEKAACSLCNSVLASKHGLKKHMRLMHNPNSIPPVKNNIIVGTKKVANVVKSVIKPQRTYAVKSSAAKAKNVEENTNKGAYACFVCQFKCNSDDGLIDHLYKFHTFRCDICNTVFAKKDEHEVHMLTHNPQLSVKQQKTEKSVESQKTPLAKANPRRILMVRRCDGCPAQYARMRNLKKHCLAMNFEWTEPLVPNKEFDPICPICGVEVHKKFNEHIAGHDFHAKAADGQIKVAKCKSCPAQFFTSKLHMDHCEKIHKIDLDILSNPADEAFNPRCPHCSKSFEFPGTLNLHLETKHNIIIFANTTSVGKDLISKTFPSPLKLPLQTSTKVSFKCLKCNVIFPDLVAANNHKKSKHAKLNNEIIKKVSQQVALIQTRFLFRCDSCDVHFTNPSQADAHAKSNCKEQKNSIPCKQCNLKININDVASHNKKHEITDEVTIIDIPKNDLNVRILCKCPSCKLHFNECDYYSHYTECSANSLIPYWCVFCHLYIDIKAQTNHDSFHYKLKLKKEALIILEYKEIVNSSVIENIEDADNVVANSVQEPKRVLADAVRTATFRMDTTSKLYLDKMEAIKTKTEGIYKLIECTFCGTFRTFHPDSADLHLGGQCKRKKRRPCNQCGLRVLNAALVTHKADHKSYPKLNIKDTLFFDESLNVMKPRVPKFFKCQHCSINFESQYHLDRHKCKTSVGIRCVQCNADIVKSYYTYHMQYHAYRLPRLSGLEYAAPRYEKNLTRQDYAHKQGAGNKPLIEDDSDQQNTIQNISTVPTFYQCSKSKKILLYQCKKCKISSVSVGFRQMHSMCKRNYFTCSICDLNFAATYRIRHELFHTHHPNLNFNSYHIIEFTYKDIFKRSKTEGALNYHPIGKRKQLKLKKRGFAVLFQCAKCKLVYTVRAFTLKHQACIKYANPHNCDICGYNCAPTLAESHKRWHELNPNVRKEHIIISSFKPGFGDVNMKTEIRQLKITTNKATMNRRPPTGNSLNRDAKYKTAGKKPIEIVTEPDNSFERDASYEITIKKTKMFQCKKCGICSTSLAFPHNHTDCENNKSFKCGQCGLKFFEPFRHNHLSFHTQTSEATLDYYNFIRFDPDACYRPIPYNKWTELSKAGKVVLLQCIDCKISSNSRLILQNHLSCDSTQPYYSCKLCGYKLILSDKPTHIATHMNLPQLKTSDIIVSQFDPKIERQMCNPKRIRRRVIKHESNDIKAKQSGERYIIFRCEICDVCTEEGMDHECKEGIMKVVCNVCSLTFEDGLYQSHASKHSDPNYSKKVEIIHIEGETPSHFRKRKPLPINETPAKIPRLSEVGSSNASIATSENDEDNIDQIIRCKCNLHFLTRQSCSNHMRTCKRDQFRQSSNVCKNCNIAFHSPKSLEEHTSRHHEANIEFTVLSYYEFHKQRKIVAIFKCRECLLFFPTFELFKSNTHIASCGVSTGVTCDFCGFEIMESFVNEHAKVHAIGRPRLADEFKVVEVSREKIPLPVPGMDSVLYKCTKCEVHFLNTDAIECHYPCENSRRHTKCPECGLKFYSASLYAHVTAQHTKHNYDINDLVIKKVDPKEDSAKEAIPDVEVELETDDDTESQDRDSISDQKPTKKHTLYQCLLCKVNFVSSKNILSHKHCSIVNPPDNFTCDKCNMTIYLPDKEEHVLVHHSEDNNLTCESDYVIHKKNSLQNNKSRRTERYPVFGCRTVKAAIKTKSFLQSVAKSRKIVSNEEEANIIYKCYECDLCFICKGSLLKHSPKYAEHESAKNKMPCDICGLQFGPLILRQHKIIHHHELHFKLEDFKILTIQDVRNDTLQESDMSISESDATNDSLSHDSVDTSISKTNSTAVVRKSAGVIESKPAKESTPGLSPKLEQQHKVKLYKCKDCNVNFLKQNLCYRHVINHEPLSTYDFLECKICTLNFPIQYLQQHMAQHKKEYFCLKDILIEEYEPLPQTSSPGCKRSTPTIDIYRAIDRVGNNSKDNSNLTEKQQSTNATGNKEIINKEPVSSFLKSLLESKNVTHNKTPPTNSSVDSSDIKIETKAEDISVDSTGIKIVTETPASSVECTNKIIDTEAECSDTNMEIETAGTSIAVECIITKPEIKEKDISFESTNNIIDTKAECTNTNMKTETPATSISVECSNTMIETETSDGDTKSLELSTKDNTSLQSMEIETDHNDGKILNDT